MHFGEFFQVSEAFVVMRQISGGFTVGRTKGKEKMNAGDKMGWATAHFRSWVAT